MMQPRKPITFEHLKQGLDLAITSSVTGKPIALMPGVFRSYDQTQWECKTTCCVHGFACYLAGEVPMHIMDRDYAEIPDDLRDELFNYLASQHTSLAEIMTLVADIDAQIGTHKP